MSDQRLAAEAMHEEILGAMAFGPTALGDVDIRSSRIIGLIVAVAVAISVSSGTGEASPIRHEFSGTITVARFGEGNPLLGQVQVGDPFSGFYEFDSDQPPAIGGACQDDLQQCTWEFSVPPNQFVVSVGSIAAATFQRYRIVNNDGVEADGNPTDFYNVVGLEPVLLNGWLARGLLVLVDSTRDAIDDPRPLFLDPPDPDDFASNRHQQFQLHGENDSDFINGRLDRLVRVPEPSTLLLLGTGLAALSVRRRRTH